MNPLAGPAGPGKYSTRTDNLQMGSIAYGEGVETAAIKSGAPLAKTPNVRPEPITELYAPTQRPEEPATTGIDMGAGAGSEVLALRKPDETNFISAISAYKPVLKFIADQPNTSPETKQIIRQLWDNL
jgi:hypothetical protein